MSRADYAAELKDLNEKARAMRDAYRKNVKTAELVEIAFRLASAKQIADRAILTLRSEVIQ